jgi:hypothetical protein
VRARAAQRFETATTIAWAEADAFRTFCTLEKLCAKKKSQQQTPTLQAANV